MSDHMSEPDTAMVLFGDKLISSSAFKTLFREGMALVEETAAYLDGPGREESRGLARAGTLAFATESMRLTTRLMQLASWLLLQRAVNEGEMSSEQARAEKHKVKLNSTAPEPDSDVMTLLPERLADLIRQSVRMQSRVRHLEEVLNKRDLVAVEQDNAVGLQLDRLRQAFSPGK